MFDIHTDIEKGICSVKTSGTIENIVAELTTLVVMVLDSLPNEVKDEVLEKFSQREFWNDIYQLKEEAQKDIEEAIEHLRKKRNVPSPTNTNAVSIGGLDFTDNLPDERSADNDCD